MGRYAYTFDDGSEESFEWDDSLGEPDDETAKSEAEKARNLRLLKTARVDPSGIDSPAFSGGYDPLAKAGIVDREKFDRMKQAPVEDLIDKPEELPTQPEIREEQQKRAWEGANKIRDTANETIDTGLGAAVSSIPKVILGEDTALPSIDPHQRPLSEQISEAVPSLYRGWNTLADKFGQDQLEIDNPEHPTNNLLGVPVGAGREIGAFAKQPADLAGIAALSAIPGAAPIVHAGFRALMAAGAVEKGYEAFQKGSEGKPFGEELGSAAVLGGSAIPWKALRTEAPRPELEPGMGEVPSIERELPLFTEGQRLEVPKVEIPKSEPTLGPVAVPESLKTMVDRQNKEVAPQVSELPEVRLDPRTEAQRTGPQDLSVNAPTEKIPERLPEVNLRPDELARSVNVTPVKRTPTLGMDQGGMVVDSDSESSWQRVRDDPNYPPRITGAGYMEPREAILEPPRYEDYRNSLPSALSTDPRWSGRIAGNADWRVVSGGLGETLYGRPKGYSIIKELIQNSVDSVRSNGGGNIKIRLADKMGDTTHTVDKGNAWIAIEDDGSGMLPEDLSAVPLDDQFGKFLKLGGTGKAGESGAAGKFGTAKAILLNNPEVIIDTVAIDPTTGRKVHSVLMLREGDMQGLYSNLASRLKPQIIEDVGDTVPTGTRIQIRTNDSHNMYQSREYIERAVGHGIKGVNVDINGAYHGENINLSSLDAKSPVIHSKDVTLPSGKFTFEAAPVTETTRTDIIYLNNGIYQGEEPYGWGEEVKAPSRVYVDVKSDILPEDPSGRYPWESNRERIRHASDAYHELENYLSELSQDLSHQRQAAYRAILTGGKEIKNSGGVKYIDALNGINPALIDEISNSEYAGILAKQIKYHMNAVATMFSKQYGDPVFEQAGELAGLGYHHKWSGINVPGSVVGAQKFQIVINPWALFERAKQLVSDEVGLQQFGGPAWPHDANQRLADTFGQLLVKTISHEVAHNKVRSHNQIAFYNQLLDEFLVRGNTTKWGENLGRLMLNHLSEIEAHASKLGSEAGTNLLGNIGLDSRIGKPGSYLSEGNRGSSEDSGVGRYGIIQEGREPPKYEYITNPVIRLNAEQLDRTLRNPSVSPTRRALVQAKLDKLLKDWEGMKNDTVDVNVIPPKVETQVPKVTAPTEIKPEVKLSQYTQLQQQSWAQERSAEIDKLFKKHQAELDKELQDGLIDESTYAGLVEELIRKRDLQENKLAKALKKYTWSRPQLGGGGNGGKKPPRWTDMGEEPTSYSPGSMSQFKREVLAGGFFRTLRTAGDLSAPLRQGIWFLPSHPVEWMKAFGEMHKAALSEGKYKEIDDKLRSSEDYKLAEMAGVHFGRGPGEMDPKLREEFYESQWAEKIPIASKFVIKPSERAYVTFLNQLRMNMFKQYADRITRGQKGGLDAIYKNNHRALSAASNYINVATGRGDLGRMEESAQTLAYFFFAPRFVSSRMQMLGMPIGSRINTARSKTGEISPVLPKEWGKSSGWSKAEMKERKKDFKEEIAAGPRPSVLFWKRVMLDSSLPMSMRKAVAADIMKDAAALVGLYAMNTAFNPNSKMEDDPTSTSFAKVEIGSGEPGDKVRHYDLLGGYRPIINMAAEIALGKKKTAMGKSSDLINPKYGGRDVQSEAARFVRGKLSPLFQLGADVATGKDFLGRPVITPRVALGQMEMPEGYDWQGELKREVSSQIQPMSWSDIGEGYQGAGLRGGLEVLLPSIYGAGVQTYNPEDIGNELKAYQKMLHRRKVRRAWD